MTHRCVTMVGMGTTSRHFTSDDFTETAMTRELVEYARSHDKGPGQSLPGLQRIEGLSQGALKLVVLGSGSKGNCSLVVGPEGAVMIDAGFSKKETLRRMAIAGVDPALVKAIIVTHEHSDHIKGVGVVSRGLDVPVYASRGTAGCESMRRQAPDVEAFANDDELTLAGLRIKVFSTSHDAVDPVGYRFSGFGDDVGVATDTGFLTGPAAEALAGVRLLALESNHDPDMLANGPYPYILKRRIASDHGHLSNVQSADALARLLSDRLEAVIAMHLSETNNLHDLPIDSLSGCVRGECHPARVAAAWQSRPTVVG